MRLWSANQGFGRFGIVAIGALALSCSSVSARCPKSGHKPGQWSKLSIELCSDKPNEGRYLEIPSPDESRKLIVRHMNLSVLVEGHEVPFPPPEGPKEDWEHPGSTTSYMAEAMWAPDSQAMFFTDGAGNVGPWRADLYRLEGGSVRHGPDVTPTIQKDFAARNPCKPSGDSPNVAGVTWVDGSKTLLVVAEVPPHQNCEANAGYFEGYVVSMANGEILARYSMEETAKRWGKVLGVRLRDDLWSVREENAYRMREKRSRKTP